MAIMELSDYDSDVNGALYRLFSSYVPKAIGTILLKGPSVDNDGYTPEFLKAFSRACSKQMKETAKLYVPKRKPANSITYYRLKIRFAPQDFCQNGGPLTPEKAILYCESFVNEFFPGHEAVLVVHLSSVLHVHAIINSVHSSSGTIRHIKGFERRAMLERTNSLAREFGLVEVGFEKYYPCYRPVDTRQ